MVDADDDWRQAAYEVVVEDEAGGCETVRVDSPDSVLVPWPVAPLTSRERATVSVRVLAGDGAVTPWSEPLTVEAALLEPSDWSAQMIAPAWDEDVTSSQPPCLLRREFVVTGDVVSARLFATARGIYFARVNGSAVSDSLLSPGWTSYDKRLRYQVCDVTPLVQRGDNAIGIAVADGWFRGYLAWEGKRNWYGDRTAALAQLEIRLSDGQVVTIATDTDWRAGQGPIRAADLYMGESYDARLESAAEGWDRASFDDSAWSDCVTQTFALDTLTAQASPPVRAAESLSPVSLTQTRAGATVVDFGQNLVGHLRLKSVDATDGERIVLRHAEILHEGELFTEPLRTAKQTDDYLAAGGGAVASWQPQFTFHGFRYAEIAGWRGPVPADAVEAVVCHSDMQRIGWFECSDELVNRLHDNAVWSMRGNFVDVPTDCPQRDERLGWTGDLQVFAPSAAFLYDCNGFLDSWLADLVVEQQPDGGVPFVVPCPVDADYTFPTYVAAAWADAAVIVPWVCYERFGDIGLLERQWPSMSAFVDACHRAHGGTINRELFQFGDWLDPTAPPGDASNGMTDRHLVAGAYLVRSLDLVVATAEVLGRSGDAARYRSLADDYRAVWRREFVRPDGLLSSDSQTAYALAVCFRLLESDADYTRAGARLAELCEQAGFRIATGFVGTPLICDALTTTGHVESAYRLLLQRECPSFLYPVTQGATTIWERWDSLKPSGEVNDAAMTSFNHYALGAVVDWLHRCVGGLAPLAPGYRSTRVRPLPGGGLTSARVSHVSPYGEHAVDWRLADGQFQCDVTVPPSTTAIVDLPVEGWQQRRLGSGRYRFEGYFDSLNM